MTDKEQFGALEWLKPSLVLNVFIGYVVAWAAYALFVWNVTSSQNAGLFGDMFGAFNAFVSGIAMLGVVAAILLQREQNRMQSEELRLQRQELADTREELRGQRQALEAQVKAAREQLTKGYRDSIQRNKPVVFCDRWEHPELENNFYYVMRNVGGGFAVNVYFIDAEKPDDTPRALGSLAPNAERRLPHRIDRLLANAAKDGVRLILIAEGPVSRTTQWTPTLNFRTPDADIRSGQVQHRVADVAVLPPRGRPQALREYLHNNGDDFLRQLRGFGLSEDA